MPVATDKPENANEHCPGTQSESAGKADACEGCPNQSICSSAPKGPDPDLQLISERMSRIKHKILVLSGKGGVGKSTVASQLAFALARNDNEVGLLDIDICGPSVPKMLGLEGEEVHQSGSGWSPVYVDDNLGVMSIGFMLPDPNEAVIWRGPRKNALIKSFIKDVDWGSIDFLVIDAPPGTSDEHISIAQYLTATGVDGAVMVSTPQEVSLVDVRKEVNFCRKVGVPILGLVENMGALSEPISCVRFFDTKQDSTVDVTERVMEAIREKIPDTSRLTIGTEIYQPTSGGVEKMSQDMDIPFLGRIPLDPLLCSAAEKGESVFETAPNSSGAVAFEKIYQNILKAVGRRMQTNQA